MRWVSAATRILLGLPVVLAAANYGKEHSKPNILFLFTDDQDYELGSLDFLPITKERIFDQGFAFDNHYVTVSLCCPSRVAMLRGQQAHNTNNTDVASPGGGYDKFRSSGENDNYLPHWLKDAGYRTEYIGKLMNGYSTDNYWFPPKGWDHYDGLLDPFTYVYNKPVFSTNGGRPKHYSGHQTDVIRAKAVDRLETLLANPDEPWFLQVAPVAPHLQFNESIKIPPVPATRHEDLFPGLKAPRTPNYNPQDQKKPSWVGDLPLMDDEAIAYTDEVYRRRAQVLTGVDEMIEDLLDVLDEAGELENTVIIFSSDNGFHLGNHRIPAGKTLPYREDTHVPFFIKGPGIPKGRSTQIPSDHVDIAPTLLTLAGLDENEWPPFLDGRTLTDYWKPDGTEGDPALDPFPETLNVEFWGANLIEASPLNVTVDDRNTYKTVRIIGKDYAFLYTHWCTHETELYDTIADPYELEPLDLLQNATLSDRMNGLLLASKTCEQESCRDPWSTLHPDGSVKSLRDALHPRHDEYYASLPRVAFKECLHAQLAWNEKPFVPGFDEENGFGQRYRAVDLLPPDDGEDDEDTVSTVEDAKYGSVFKSLEEIEGNAKFLGNEMLAPEWWGGVAKKFKYRM
ncbi:hypothetical protein FQN54_002798 [Arachnomyces sp. PD_36]|nr:hypothetical protein FQN54_002798 [Arachnomyces sp. PD_36]